MSMEEFLLGRLSGYGAVHGVTGRVLRRYRVDIHGVWADAHRAMHVDETYTYFDQPGEFHRSWVVHTDEQGYVVGHDAVQAARFRGRTEGDDIRLVFDRPVRPGGRTEPKQIVRFIHVTPERIMMVGRMVLFGMPIATTHTALTRLK
jgi:hypothetical protein